MMYELTKLLSFLVEPLGISLMLLIGGLCLLILKRPRAGRFVLVTGTMVLWGFSTPGVADWLLGGLERDWPQARVEDAPAADAILVLGGAFNSGNGQLLYPQAGGQVNRYWHAARLYRAGRAPRIIVSGGRNPHHPAGLTEAEAGAIFLEEMGVPRHAIVMEQAALTTRGHAVELPPLLDRYNIDTVLVVTSAAHMRRAVGALADVGVRLIPVATDHSSYEESGFRLHRIIPSASALSRSTRAMHEVTGVIYYRLMGWIQGASPAHQQMEKKQEP
ncbi:MAG: hypothetical protein ABS41_07370 [Arenimonas sp. SCN 70-307]|uniref:YdcF family protein n=1 Tax=Arenimonas sp. SCN 70-307 TaxID=1660089 RepID=UPI00086F39E2|nr:YdcF family protein [Arenimonas sp. SCN 70-307]ODS62986.1 MAG: hypothetical protein ABS41_07370 [Arenimonas sp. SCN 70-307]